MKRYTVAEAPAGFIQVRIDECGAFVLHYQAQIQIDSRDKRIAELEALLAHGAEARSEMLDEIHARGARIAELEAALDATAVLP